MQGSVVRRALLAGMLAIAVALTACSRGSSPSKTPTPASTKTSATAAHASATSPAPATPLASATVDQASTAAPAPSVTAGVRACTAADIESTASEQGVPGSIGGSMMLRNTSAAACSVGQPASEFSLIDAHGEPLAVQLTALPGMSLASVTLPPAQSTSVTFTWSNWCSPAPASPVSIALTLGSGQVVKTAISGSDASADATPRCDDSSQPSTLAMSGFSPAQ